MSRPIEHECVRDILFRLWMPVVMRDGDGVAGYPRHTIEHTLHKYRGETPDPGHPPEWPEGAWEIEQQVVRMRPELRDTIRVEVLYRDEDGHRPGVYARAREMGVSKSKYHQLVYAACDALWQVEAVREVYRRNKI